MKCSLDYTASRWLADRLLSIGSAGYTWLIMSMVIGQGRRYGLSVLQNNVLIEIQLTCYAVKMCVFTSYRRVVSMPWPSQESDFQRRPVQTLLAKASWTGMGICCLIIKCGLLAVWHVPLKWLKCCFTFQTLPCSPHILPLCSTPPSSITTWPHLFTPHWRG